MIALDTNVFIYILNGHEQFGPLAAKLLKSSGPKMASRLVYAEVLSSPKLEDEILRSKVLLFLDELDIKWQEINDNVNIEAARLRRQQPKLKLVDALHLASAIISNAEAFFTNDKDLQLLKTIGLEIKGL